MLRFRKGATAAVAGFCKGATVMGALVAVMVVVVVEETMRRLSPKMHRSSVQVTMRRLSPKVHR